MLNAIGKLPGVFNEPILPYAPGSPERKRLKAELARQYGETIEIPLVIGGKKVWTDQRAKAVCPHEHKHVLAEYCLAGPREVQRAIDAACAAQREWEETPWEERASIFLKAAELVSGKYRDILNAATMLNQSKNAYQAEIDAACELADFFRFNAWYMRRIYEDQPPMNPQGMWNRVEYRPLEGFVFAITPFNFTSIAGNLAGAPAQVGNVVVWKPSPAAVFSGYKVMQLFEEAGLPAGVINFVPGDAAEVLDTVVRDVRLAGIHFTGSTAVFSDIWKQVAANLRDYRAYPRIVGETGGKDFIVVHPSADVNEVMVAAVRGAFEYQGQKCSAASRMYVPASLWPSLKERMGAALDAITLGDPRNFSHFMNAVIHEKAFDKLTGYIEKARGDADAKVIFGGTADKSEGYFVHPTVIETTNPVYTTMREELFGPVLTVDVYDDAQYEETLRLCDESSWYSLTGAIFSHDRKAVQQAMTILRHAAGNFYINDKPTGAVVGQQPFGGSRASGTNDKAGSYLNLLRWISPRTIKETFCPPTDYRYPFMAED